MTINISDYPTDIQGIIKDNNLAKTNGTLHKTNVMKWLVSEESKASPSATIIATMRILNRHEQLFGKVYKTRMTARKAANKVVRGMGYKIMTPDMAIWFVVDEIRTIGESYEIGVISTKEAVRRGTFIFGVALYDYNTSHYKMHQALVEAGMQPNTEIVYSKNGDGYVKINYHIE